ncbi:hypothetical protein KM803_09595 [Clostridium tyrobutyricum]|uniref:hypothetical protein n=1 Tax=Clostridium tyrobutyricum TaxID=1519 RepID=UPI001C394DCC|nr:hypothetical protein [Clostridium tyrobutyricum]MBV4431587.1 hypothetical protein [Clostridium tyrobutyricum]
MLEPDHIYKDEYIEVCMQIYNIKNVTGHNEYSAEFIIEGDQIKKLGDTREDAISQAEEEIKYLEKLFISRNKEENQID